MLWCLARHWHVCRQACACHGRGAHTQPSRGTPRAHAQVRAQRCGSPSQLRVNRNEALWHLVGPGRGADFIIHCCRLQVSWQSDAAGVLCGIAPSVIGKHRLRTPLATDSFDASRTGTGARRLCQRVHARLSMKASRHAWEDRAHTCASKLSQLLTGRRTNRAQYRTARSASICSRGSRS